MVSGKVTIVNKLGLHARPAGLFVKEMANFKSDITIIKVTYLNDTGLHLTIVESQTTFLPWCV